MVRIVISHIKYKGLQRVYLKQILSWDMKTWDYTFDPAEAGRFTTKQSAVIRNILSKKPTVTTQEENI